MYQPRATAAYWTQRPWSINSKPPRGAGRTSRTGGFSPVQLLWGPTNKRNGQRKPVNGSYRDKAGAAARGQAQGLHSESSGVSAGGNYLSPGPVLPPCVLPGGRERQEAELVWAVPAQPTHTTLSTDRQRPTAPGRPRPTRAAPPAATRLLGAIGSLGFFFFFFSRLSNHYYTIWVGFFLVCLVFFLTTPISFTFVNPKVTLKTKEFIKSKPFILPKLRRLLNSPSCNRIPLGIAGSARYSRLLILTT